MKTLWNEEFFFKKLSVETDYSAFLLDEAPFEPVEIPHDFLIYDTYNLYEDATGWYKKNFVWSKENGEMLLTFDGIYMDSEIYVNQTKAGEWKYGYSSFSINISKYLLEGENELVVRVCHKSPNSRWYSGAGIYRNVWVRYLQDSYIEEKGVYVHTDCLENDSYKLTIETGVVGNGQVVQALYDEDGQPVELTFVSQETVKTEPGHIGGCSATGACADDTMTDRQIFTVAEVSKWSPDEPHLYTLVTKLTDGEKVSDEVSTVIGFRSVELHPNLGFLLNGKQIKLNGVCEHHDLGAFGAAFNEAAQRRKYVLLKEMGVNAIRFAHNMPDPGCLKLCDEMGFLVMDESFDMWERPKTQYDYARFFEDWHERDMESFVKRDRNHPCVVLWSVGNEIYDTHGDAMRGKEITGKLKSLVNRFDPMGNAPVTFASNYLAWDNTQHSANLLDAVGYNYTERYYEEHHETYPERVIFGSETASIVYSRGIYHFPLEACILSDDDEQCSALGNSVTSWGAKSLECCICEDRDMGFSMGQFLWTGTDYIGEPTPYHTKNSYFGQIDTAGFPKDSYYIFKSAWTDYKKAPMIHVFPYWDFNEGQCIDVRICSNAPEVELFLNGVSRGRQTLTHAPGSGMHILADYKVTYEPGTLLAVAYDEDGNEVCREEKTSFGDAKEIVLTADKTILEHETDAVFITVSAVDLNGHPVENATNRVEVEVKGSGRLVGLDNGDSTDYDSYKGVSRCLFSGKLLAIVMTKGEAGDIEVCVKAKGLGEQSIVLHSAVDCTKGLHKTENQICEARRGSFEDIPVRSVSIKCMAENDSDGSFGMKRIIEPKAGAVTVKTSVGPADASDRTIYVEAVNDTGVVTNLVKLSVAGKDAEPRAGLLEIKEEDTILLHPMGDGAFRIRAMSKSGTDSYRIISELEFEQQGFGTAFLDPYSFVTGSLYSRTNGKEGAGNEKGVATSREGETIITYDNLDFGSDFASEITIPIFALNDEKYDISIYEGTPDDGCLIGQVVYQKPSIWNVYQEETYVLNKRLTGVKNISFVFYDKVHMKGFSFKRQEKAFADLSAGEADAIYGDTFNRTEDAVEQIGNNVSLVFGNMDFGEKGTASVKICGRAHGTANTIHLRFADGETESKQIIEFPACEDYIEQEFAIEKMCGKKEVSFVFLPGSCFDFRSFKFI